MANPGACIEGAPDKSAERRCDLPDVQYRGHLLAALVFPNGTGVTFLTKYSTRYNEWPSSACSIMTAPRPEPWDFPRPKVILLSKPTTSEYIRGSLYGIAAVSIWASWIVAVRLGIRTSLKPWDITAIRFGIAGLILLPYLLKKGLAVDRLGWAGLAAIMLGGGAAMVLVSYGGLLFAPAAHAASLYTALIPLYVAILAAFVLREAFTVAKRIGLVLIATGVLGIVWGAGGMIGARQNIGHALFISAGMLWACYVVAMRKARLDGLHAAAIAAVGSLITYVPVYAIIFGTSLFKAPWHDLVLQAFVHGLLVAVISFFCIGRAVSILGASNGSAFAALAPAITAILAIPILGEWPATSDWIAMLLISGGVYIASGAPLPATRLRTSAPYP
jgi:drug/metabolite transporter (DMT)-like permease